VSLVSVVVVVLGADERATFNSVISKRFVKRQSMQWTKRGAHLLLQMRVKTLNNELAATFRGWYPDFQVEDTALAA